MTDKPEPVATPTPDIDPEEVRRALESNVWAQRPLVFETDRIGDAAREWLRLREQPAPRPCFAVFETPVSGTWNCELPEGHDAAHAAPSVHRVEGCKDCHKLLREQPAPDVQAQKWEPKCNCPGDYARYVGDDPHNRWCPRSRNPHPEVIQAQIDAAVERERGRVIGIFVGRLGRGVTYPPGGYLYRCEHSGGALFSLPHAMPCCERVCSLAEYLGCA